MITYGFTNTTFQVVEIVYLKFVNGCNQIY